MNFNRRLWYNWIADLILFWNCANVNCFHISSPNVLLAYNLGLPSNWTVEVVGAQEQRCFEWRSSNPHIVHITPIFHLMNCSKQAVLSSIAYLFSPQITQVSASLVGQVDNHVSSINVITDNVAQIALSYTSNELILGGPPQILTLVGKNKHGHTFTSIDGLEVHWNINHEVDQSVDPFGKQAVVRFSKFVQSNSLLTDCPLERQGLYTPSVVVEPMSLGSATISASLFFTSRQTLHTKNITLRVIPNWRINPSSCIYLLRHSSMKIKIEKVFKDTMEELKMENWKVEVENADVIKMSEDQAELYGNAYGISKISYQNTDKGYLELVATAHVVKLARTDLRISKGDYKIFEEMKIYEVFLDLFDEEDNLIYATDNLRFTTSFPAKLFHVLFLSSNGTYAIVQTIAPGSGTIRNEYKGVVLENGTLKKEWVVSSSTNVTVYQKLTIFPQQTLLPLLSPGLTFYEVPLMVTGGSGKYTWSMSDCTKATINEKEHLKNSVRVQANEEIDLIITVADESNRNIMSTAKISIQSPLDIEVYPTVVEAEVENSLIIPVALLGYEDKGKKTVRKFDDCSKSQLEIEIIDPYIIMQEKENKVPEFGKGCVTLQFRCKAAGHSRVNILHTLHKGQTGNLTYKTTTLLSCYKPLKPIHPVRAVVLALGTSKDVAFEGGPRKWPLQKEDHYTELEASNPDLVKIELIKDPVRYNRDLTVFRVTCLALGENTLLFRIGNHPSATLQHPGKADASIKFICEEPHSLNLKLFKKNSNRKEELKNLVKVPFYGEKRFAVDIWVKDAMGRKFANISSLRVVWNVSEKELAEPESEWDFQTHENAVAGFRKLTRNFKEFKMTGDSGKLKVGAKIEAYRQDVLTKEGVYNYKELKEISNDIELNLVSLRDLNPGSYATAGTEIEDNVCEHGSCKE